MIQPRLTEPDPDVQDYQVSLKEQTVLVDSTLSYKEVLEKITKTGKTVNSGKEDGDRRPYKIAEDGELVPLSSEEQEQAEEDKPVDGDKKEDSKPAESEEQAVDSKKDGKEQ